MSIYCYKCGLNGSLCLDVVLNVELLIYVCREWLFILNVALMSIYRYMVGQMALCNNICLVNVDLLL